MVNMWISRPNALHAHAHTGHRTDREGDFARHRPSLNGSFSRIALVLPKTSASTIGGLSVESSSSSTTGDTILVRRLVALRPP